MNIDIEVFADIAPDHLEGFKLLLNKIGEIPIWSEHFYLRKILVAPKDAVPSVTKTILERQTGSEQISFIPAADDGAAIPIFEDEQMYGFIIVSKELIEKLTPDNFYNWDTTATVIEEMLHIQLYSIIWDKNARPNYADIPRCRNDFVNIANYCHDEYVIACWKSYIFASYPLVLTDNDELTTGAIITPSSIANGIEKAGTKLRDVVEDVTTRQIEIIDAWKQSHNCVMREIFGSLARDAGRKDTLTDGVDHIFSDAEMSVFYRRYVANYWVKFLDELRQSTDNEFDNHQTRILRLAEIIEQFFRQVGITATETDDPEICYYHFDAQYLT